MLTKKLACPSCGVGLRLSGATPAGKRIRCPKCGDTFPVSTGNGATSGMHKITGDITEMAAQIPALFETLSGMPFGELFAKVRRIGDNSSKPDDRTKGTGTGTTQ